MPPGGVSGVGRIILIAGSTPVDATDAQGKKSLATGSHEPVALVLLLNGKRRVRAVFGDGERSAESQRQRQHGHGSETGVLQQLAEGEAKVVHGLLER